MAALWILNIVSWILQIYRYCLIARILMSWVPDLSRTRVGYWLARITEPYLGIFRRFIPPVSMGGGYLDFSPIVAFIAYYFVETGLMRILALLFGGLGL